METCKNCLHYGICTFHVTGNENKKCTHYTPTADVAEVRRGEWVYGENEMCHCSECGNEEPEHSLSPYCPECGAYMDDEEDQSDG